MGDWIDIQADYSFFVACQRQMGVPFGECPSHDEAGAYCMGGEL